MKAKRTFDFILSLIMLIVLAIPIILCIWAAAIDTRSNGVFVQKRIGRFGRPFKIIKVRTIRERPDGRRSISRLGKFFRDAKIDELPQLLNVLRGDMSLVGPRPDIAGYYDKLEGEAKKILELRPGITSLASVKYRDEEQLLARHRDSARYNDEVIFPDKVKMNLEYYYNRTFAGDLRIIGQTILNLIKRK